MDSLSQLVLWAGVAGALGVRKLGKKAYVRGMILATVPDLDVFIGPLLYGSTLDASFFHRWLMHSLIFCVLFGVLSAVWLHRIYRIPGTFRTWLWLCITALVTHPLLDSLTNYGTKLFLPFTDTAFSLNSIFIIDPLYTIPFVFCIVVALLVKNRHRSWVWSIAWLALSTSYLLVGLVAKSYVHSYFVDALATQGIVVDKVMSTPEALQVILWRSVAVNSWSIYQWWYSFLDQDTLITYNAISRNTDLLEPYVDNTDVQKVLARTQWYYFVRPTSGWVLVSDARFGWLNAWSQTGTSDALFGYTIWFSGDTIVVREWHRGGGRTIDREAFRTLWQRILWQ